MIELPDDELDKLFRKSSEELDPTFDPEDWNKLRKRLDQQDGRNPAGWWKKWWPLGLLAVAIPAGVLLYSYSGDEEKEKSGIVSVGENGGMEEGRKGKSGVVREEGNGTNGKSEVVEDGENGRAEKGTKEVADGLSRVDREVEHGRGDEGRADKSGSLSGVVKERDNIVAVGKEIGKSSSKSELNAAASKGSEILPRSRSKAGGVYLEPNRSKVEGGDGALFIKKNANKGNVKSSRGKTSPTQVPDLPNGNEPGKPLSEDRKDEVENVSINGGGSKSKGNAPVDNTDVSAGEVFPQFTGPSRTLISASELNGKMLKWSALQLPGISNPIQELPEPPKPSQPSMSADDQPLWAVRFGYSPDLSTVGLKDFSKPGTAVSLLVEYSVLPRLFVQSGAVWSRKDYYAPAEAYQLPKKGHYPPLALSGIDGVCKVLEIPLNLRYDIALRERSRWFATGGFSSYHMNSEKYKYNYIDPNDPNAKWAPGWDGKTGWYWLSHANVSAGYEYRISRKLSLLAEPSVRMPLKRVGYGKVNLITTGFWLSVRYTPVFK
jgi:hypothetical protein